MKLKPGNLYIFKFLDHCVGADEAIVCEVVGWLEKESKNHVTVNTWRIITDCNETYLNNRELKSLVKSCILKITKLTY